jgi:diadenosine tetraphosphatase ApaH/serine/threonine PP2A family protein phosphatase
LRILLLSDVHANLEALQACLDVAPSHDLIVNLGDVVGYNASPNEVCTLVRAMGGLIIRGNHDRACSGLTDLSDFNPVAAMSAYWTRGGLGSEHLEWLRALPQGPVRRDGFPGVEFVHGSPRDEDEYLLNNYGAENSFRVPGHLNRIFFGHTHVQGGFFLERGKTRAFAVPYENGQGLGKFTMELDPADRYLINPGSVGQPRDGDWRAAFALYDDTPGSVTFYRVPYAVEVTQERIRAALLPDRLASRLTQGR